MKKAGLHKNLKKLQTKCAALAVEVGKSFLPDAIHQFRIEYKKLRSYLAFISFLSRDEKKFRIRNRAKKHYELAGHIRDEFLFLQRLRKMASPGTIFLQENVVRETKSIRALKKEWKNARPFPPLKKCIVRPSSNHLPEKVSLSDFNSYLKNNERRIFSVVNGKDLSDSQFHTLRKIIKERMYNLRWWEKQKGEKSVSSKIKSQTSSLQNLLTDLGDYNDLVTFQRQLKKTGNKKTKITFFKQLNLLREKVKSENQEIKSKLVSEINAVYRE
jgi:CHAD domain-containing protein